MAEAATMSSRDDGTVLFVCEHGAVKSVLAALLFERCAAGAGLALRAISRGTDIDAEVPGWLQARLSTDGLALDGRRPTALRPEDLRDASYVVTFDLPDAVSAATPAPRARWDGIPPASEDFVASREAIDARVRGLVEVFDRELRSGD